MNSVHFRTFQILFLIQMGIKNGVYAAHAYTIFFLTEPCDYKSSH